MASGIDYFLKKTLGDDFLESLQKVELYKPGTKTTVDHEELKTALQIVPRTIMALLVRELAPMAIGDNKKILIPVPGEAYLNVTKHERDVYSGDIVHGPQKIVEFKFRALPGVGLVIMSAFELYDMENLINSNQETAPQEGVGNKVQRMIDERLALHDLIGKVVDKKIMEKEAIHQMVLSKLTEAMSQSKEKSIEKSGPAPISIEIKEKGSKHLKKFLESRKVKKNEFSVQMAKGEVVSCPDCKKNIFDGNIFSSCVCFGDSGKVYLKKTEEGIKVRFSKGWDTENIEMLLEVLRRKRG